MWRLELHVSWPLWCMVALQWCHTLTHEAYGKCFITSITSVGAKYAVFVMHKTLNPMCILDKGLLFCILEVFITCIFQTFPNADPVLLPVYTVGTSCVLWDACWMHPSCNNNTCWYSPCAIISKFNQCKWHCFLKAMYKRVKWGGINDITLSCPWMNFFVGVQQFCGFVAPLQPNE